MPQRHLHLGLKVFTDGGRIENVAMHKNESLAKGSGKVTEAEPDSRPEDSVKTTRELVGPHTEAKPESRRPDPTRYGDWERNGRCIDF